VPDVREAAVRGILGALLVAAVVAVYAQVRHHAYINYDDDLYVVENVHVRSGLTREGLAWAATFTGEGNWIPLTWISFMVDAEIGDLEPGPTLLANVALHALATALLFWVLSGATGAPGRSAFVAAVFGLHPLHVESVAWAAERKDVLCGVFWMLTLAAHVRYARAPSWGRYGLVALALAAALLSKAMAVTLPFVLLLLDLWPLGRLASSEGEPAGRIDRGRLVRAALEKVPLLLLVAAASAVTLEAQAQVRSLASGAALPLAARLENALVSYAAYAADAVWPHDLSVFYPYPVGGVPGWQVAGASAFLVAASALALAALRRCPAVAVGWCWYLGTLIPVIGLVQVGAQARADRYTYLPLVGLAIAVAWGVPALLERRPRLVRIAAVAGFAGVAALAAVARRQVGHWRDGVAVFEQALHVAGPNLVTRGGLGVALLRAGRVEEGVQRLAANLGIDGSSPRAPEAVAAAFAEMGASNLTAGDLVDAVLSYRSAIAVEPDRAAYREGAGRALLAMGRLDESEARFAEAHALDPKSSDALLGLGAVAAQRGERQAALARFREAWQLAPGSEAGRALAEELIASGEPAEAVEVAEAASRAGGGSDPELLALLGRCYAAVGRFPEAARAVARGADLARAGGQLRLAAELEARRQRYARGETTP
jgi:protein O-mannosyl-transferase